MVIISILSLSACSDSGIEFKIAFSGQGVFGSKENENGSLEYRTEAIVRSLEELRDLCTEWNNPSFQRKTGNEANDLYRIIISYDEEFFKENALLIYSSLQWNRAMDPKVKRITIWQTELTLHIKLKKRTVNTVAESITFIIELKKEDIQEITAIGTTITNK